VPIAATLAKGRPVTEPAARSSVNRSYYAAFGEASDYVVARGFVRRRGGGTHDQVWKYVESGVVDGDARRMAERRAIAAQGRLLKIKRHKADYQRGSKLAKTEPTDALNDARRIIQALDSLVP
jgi:uncharacterized protein (UPF0332 family)